MIMHDLGLAPRFQSDARFDVGGANAARAWLVEAGMDERRADVVWDIVALHASSAIAQHKSPETAVANSGISIDVRGAGTDRLPIDDVRRVLDAFPRAGFPEAFHRTLVDEVRRNPTRCGCRGWRAWRSVTSTDTVPPTSRPASSTRPGSADRLTGRSSARRRMGRLWR